MNKIPITYLMFVYNEEKRIKYVLEHAVKWADEVIVFNKSSSDKTKDIALGYGGKVRIVDIPYTDAGHADLAPYIKKYPKNDWVYIGTASEIPTRKLIDRVKKTLSEKGDELDQLHVPRKMFSFGINSPNSPWYISYYPFVINIKRTIFSITIHDNFKARTPENIAKIEYSDDCCVYHFSHATVKSYMQTMMQYNEMEAECCCDPDAKIAECFEQIAKFEKRLREEGPDLLGQYCAWPIYWLGTALFIWEKYRGVDVKKYYQKLSEDLIKKEWKNDKDEFSLMPEIKNKVKPKWLFSDTVVLGKSSVKKERFYLILIKNIRAFLSLGRFFRFLKKK